MIDPAISQLFEEHLPARRAKRSRSELLPPDMYMSIPLAYRDGERILESLLDGLEQLSPEDQDVRYAEWDTQATRDTLARMFKDLYSTTSTGFTQTTWNTPNTITITPTTVTFAGTVGQYGNTTAQLYSQQMMAQALQQTRAIQYQYYVPTSEVVGLQGPGSQPLKDPIVVPSGGPVPTDARQKVKSALAEWSKKQYDKAYTKVTGKK